ncbi:MAG: triose-phosphate isomerase [Pseudomonadota bacterium]
MRRILIAGNWKMNCLGTDAIALADGVSAGADPGVDWLVCPPDVYLGEVAKRLSGSNVQVGAQNVSEYDFGAYTGESAAGMLADVGCSFVIVGHSERRALFGETDKDVGAKAARAVIHGLAPVVCVGETLEQREAGETERVVIGQLEAVAGALGVAGMQQMVVAYEPVWAIGTGLTATPEQAQEVHAVLRSTLRAHDGALAETTRILYGGSMKPANAASLLAMPDVDGGLIGGASLKVDDFLAIGQAAA